MAISLDNIVGGVRIKPPKIVLYGVGGIGKTTFAAGAPKPIFLFTEEGQGSLDVKRFEPRPNDPVLRSWGEIIECLSFLREAEHDFETIVLDTMDFAEPLLQRYTAERWSKTDIEEFGYGKGYVYAAEECRNLLAWLDLLRTERKMAVVVLCHSETKKFESPELASYDRYKLRLHDKVAAIIHDWADALLFANYRTHVVTDKEAFNRERKRAVGQGERIIHTEERPAFWAKNRYGLPPELPLSWKAFQDAIIVPEPQPQPEKAS